MPPELETPRLLLQPLRIEDAEQVQQLFPVWEVVRYLAGRVPWPFPPGGVYRFYRDVALPGMESGKQWHWTLRLKTAPGAIIGAITLQDDPDTNRGFWLGVPWQGQGLMTEACAIVTDYWFDTLGFPVLRIPKAAVNLPSRRISEKSGMRLIATEERAYVCGRLLTEIWEISAEEWRSRRAR
ncbi:MAG: GNAT family N-acetyltransferase [Bryobacteraceae bacterium]